MADEQPKHEPDPHVRVVDRRWWARTDEDGGGAEDAGLRKPTYVEDLERQLADKNAQLQTYITEHRRSLDEFEQVKQRIRRDVAREVERGKRAVLAELLDVVDNLDRALAAARAQPSADHESQPADDTAGPAERVASAGSSIVHGVQLVRDQFLSKLDSFGVTRVPALGQPFDASRHEAVTTTPVQDASEDGRVVAVVREGYAIGEDVLRPASVVVGQYDA